MRNRLIFVVILMSLLLTGCNNTTQESKNVIKQDGASIVKNEEGGFDLYVDGEQTYIKGVGGTNKIDLAAQNGANAFRTWGGDINSISLNIELASENNMFIMQGISLPKDPELYKDEDFKSKTMQTVKTIVETFKDDPNILIWGLGNEIELGGNNNTANSWGFVEELAEMIKSIDSRHLVATVISHNPDALDTIVKYAPSLDLIGINSYGPIEQVENIVEKSSYDGPYMITEWGPTGWWETSNTEWGAPIEQTSEEKRIVYENRYNNYIYGSKRCLGSFVFLWGQKEERTPTWFSMFVENDIPGLPLKGEKTPMVEAMERVWKRTEPAQTAPIINNFKIDGKKGTESPYVNKGESFIGELDVVDKEGDDLTFVWEILKEATVVATGGAYEPRPDRVGEVDTTKTNTLNISVSEPGNYRLYVYVLDNTGFASTANIPFQVTDY
ncbi:MAG: glycoside hydrolase family 2 TIM barrel-domain containing protein [Fermentimonas sp.]|nr:glycoside hydrolase family 2 TIM barrel-domain containing protein [Fermentimonas sp.]